MAAAPSVTRRRAPPPPRFARRWKGACDAARLDVSGTRRVGIADLRAAHLEAAAEFIRIGDDEVFHLVERAVVAKEPGFEFFRVCGRGHLDECRVFRGVAAGAPGLAPDCVVEAAFGVGVELEEGLEFDLRELLTTRDFATGAEAGKDEAPERDQESDERRPVTQEPEWVAA